MNEMQHHMEWLKPYKYEDKLDIPPTREPF